MYGVTLSVANLALTAFLTASALGVLVGGFIADATRRHGNVAAACFAGAALLIATVGTVHLGSALLILCMGSAGFLSGMIAPSRDMLVRAAAPPGAAGRVFGIVTTGFNIGGTDRTDARWLDYGSRPATTGVLRVGVLHAADSDDGVEQRAPIEAPDFGSSGVSNVTLGTNNHRSNTQRLVSVRRLCESYESVMGCPNNCLAGLDLA